MWTVPNRRQFENVVFATPEWSNTLCYFAWNGLELESQSFSFDTKFYKDAGAALKREGAFHVDLPAPSDCLAVLYSLLLQ